MPPPRFTKPWPMPPKWRAMRAEYRQQLEILAELQADWFQLF
jgi:hypothetical protein